MKKKNILISRLIFLVLLILISGELVRAGTTGKIVGKVLDAETGDP